MPCFAKVVDPVYRVKAVVYPPEASVEKAVDPAASRAKVKAKPDAEPTKVGTEAAYKVVG